MQKTSDELLSKYIPIAHELKKHFTPEEVNLLENHLAWLTALNAGDIKLPESMKKTYQQVEPLFLKYSHLNNRIAMGYGVTKFTTDHGFNDHKPRWHNKPEEDIDGSNRDMTRPS